MIGNCGLIIITQNIYLMKDLRKSLQRVNVEGKENFQMKASYPTKNVKPRLKKKKKIYKFSDLAQQYMFI